MCLRSYNKNIPVRKDGRGIPVKNTVIPKGDDVAITHVDPPLTGSSDDCSADDPDSVANMTTPSTGRADDCSMDEPDSVANMASIPAPPDNCETNCKSACAINCNGAQSATCGYIGRLADLCANQHQTHADIAFHDSTAHDSRPTELPDLDVPSATSQGENSLETIPLMVHGVDEPKGDVPDICEVSMPFLAAVPSLKVPDRKVCL